MMIVRGRKTETPMGQAQETAVVVGTGGIGNAVCRHLRQTRPEIRLVTVSRNPEGPAEADSHLHCDYDASGGLESVIEALADLPGQSGSPVTEVYLCTGVLHREADKELPITPEKRLEDLDPEMMLEVLRINTVLPAMWLRYLLPVIKSRSTCRVAVLSARVGSIADNHKGGWYSYRASKAALNMIVRTAAIEYARRAPNVKLFAFHPGTVDTGLSKPFQRYVPEGKLFDADFVAERLVHIASELEPDGEASYVDWAGERIEW